MPAAKNQGDQRDFENLTQNIAHPIFCHIQYTTLPVGKSRPNWALLLLPLKTIAQEAKIRPIWSPC
jgi:hypothetical protein